MMEKSMFKEERLVGQGLERWQYFSFARAYIAHPLGFVLLVVPFLTGLGPWERTPGGKLLGQVNAEQVSDWSFVSDAKRCAVETRPQFPHSVTVNCWSMGGQLYIGCMNCQGKIWSRYLLEEPNVRVRVLDTIYPVVFTRVNDQEEMLAAWRARWMTMQRPEPVPKVPGHYYLFSVTSR